MSAPELGPIGKAICCREWPVYVQWQMRKCGECGVVPVIVSVEPETPTSRT